MSIKPEFFDYLAHFGTTETLDTYRRHRSPAIALRHDVDYSLDSALELACWEAEHGIRATYFLLHTAPYWDDPRLLDKCAQLADFGHEIGLHTNLLPAWYEHGGAPEEQLTAVLARLRAGGLAITGSAAHGDPLCYRARFINYWVFSELRPDDPAAREARRNAEGIVEPDPSRAIGYPGDHSLHGPAGSLPLWRITMAAHGLEYEASHLDYEAYYSDSGGHWKRSPNPLGADLRGRRVQVLMHPEHWQGEPRAFFFLSTARSGSKWLATVLDQASSCVARHEFTLNHRRGEDGGAVADKLTGEHLAELLADPARVAARLDDAAQLVAAIPRDYAEANVYLPLVLDALRARFPDAELLHLHRDPRAVLRSLMNRAWYDTPDDSRHPAMAPTAEWTKLDPFERCACYIAATHRAIAAVTASRLALERAVGEPGYLAAFCREHRIAFYPRLAAPLIATPVNANTHDAFPPYEQWSAAQQAVFARRCAGTLTLLGYAPPTRLRAHGRRVRGLLADAWRHARRRLQRRSATLLMAENGEQLLARANALHCELAAGAAGLAFHALHDGSHASVLFGAHGWNRLGRGDGWSIPPDGYLALELDYSIPQGLRAVVLALLFDADGHLRHRRPLGALESGRERRRFTFGRLHGCPRFALALYLPMQDVPRAGTLRRLHLTRHLAG